MIIETAAYQLTAHIWYLLDKLIFARTCSSFSSSHQTAPCHPMPNSAWHPPHHVFTHDQFDCACSVASSCRGCSPSSDAWPSSLWLPSSKNLAHGLSGSGTPSNILKLKRYDGSSLASLTLFSIFLCTFDRMSDTVSSSWTLLEDGVFFLKQSTLGFLPIFWRMK